MDRRLFLLGLPAVLAGIPAFAADPTVERILRDLRGMGYSVVSVERTLLGRTRILADSREASREVIVNTSTGEILRDLWMPKVAESSGSGGLIGEDAASGSGTGSGDDGDDDDDDNSGKGGGDDGDDDSGRGRGSGGDG